MALSACFRNTEKWSMKLNERMIKCWTVRRIKLFCEGILFHPLNSPDEVVNIQSRLPTLLEFLREKRLEATIHGNVFTSALSLPETIHARARGEFALQTSTTVRTFFRRCPGGEIVHVNAHFNAFSGVRNSGVRSHFSSSPSFLCFWEWEFSYHHATNGQRGRRLLGRWKKKFYIFTLWLISTCPSLAALSSAFKYSQRSPQ